jgi:Uri superfamily endonuclease
VSELTAASFSGAGSASSGCGERINRHVGGRRRNWNHHDHSKVWWWVTVQEGPDTTNLHWDNTTHGLG